MRISIGLCLALVGCFGPSSQTTAPSVAPGRAPSAEPYDLSKTGIDWHEGLESVVGRGKPILLLHVLGNYDEVHC